MSNDIVVALIALGGSALGSGAATLWLQRVWERRIATSRAIGEQFAKERFDRIQRLGLLLREIERVAEVALRQRMQAFSKASDTVSAAAQLQALADYGVARDSTSDALANAIGDYVDFAGARPAVLPTRALQPMAAPSDKSPLQALRGIGLCWRRLYSWAFSRSESGDRLTKEQLDGLLYRWRPLDETETGLEAEFRDVLADAYLFLSPKVVQRFDTLLPRALRGDAKALAKLRSLLREAMEGAHRA